MKRIVLAACLGLLASVSWAETRIPQSQSQISLSFAPLVKRAAPAVVNIYAKIVTEQSASPFQSDPFFEQFFRGLGAPRQKVENSLGSGVILSGDGIVVSNYHVVGRATDIRVVLSDRREFSAQVLLADEGADLAILKLEGLKPREGQDLPYLELRDSDQVEVGELVLAIGNPFGVGQTVSSGIVSGLARSGAITGNGRGYFIQTDAPINPGNSGGALIDVNGRLIGINTSILTRSGGSNGIGFAIPANLVREFMAQARLGKAVFDRPWAGLSAQGIDADLADSLGLDVPEGVLISDLHPQSPLAASGLKVGDVITAVDGYPVNSGQEMLFRMSVAGIGTTADVLAIHRGRERHFQVALIPPPDTPARETLRLSRSAVFPGLELARINPAVIAEMGLSQSSDGVVIADPGPVGARAGLRRGDLVRSVNKRSIARPADMDRALRASGKSLRIELDRDGQRVSLRFRL
ncbi:MAG: trypsin-like peptidase domain-containing protein [Marinibacterium sp.]